MKIIFWPKSDFFVNFRNLVFFIDDCYELSYEQSEAKLVSEGALGALFDLVQKYCKYLILQFLKKQIVFS